MRNKGSIIVSFCFLVLMAGCMLRYEYMYNATPEVQGKVIDAENSLPLESVGVFFKEFPENKVHSDKNGSFYLQAVQKKYSIPVGALPAHPPQPHGILMTSMDGYDVCEIEICSSCQDITNGCVASRTGSLLTIQLTKHPVALVLTSEVAPPIALEISISKPSYSIGETVTLYIRFFNVTDLAVSIPPKALLDEHHIWLTMFDGNNQVSFRSNVVTMSMSNLEDIILQPRGSYILKWELSSIYYTMPHKPGKYKLFSHYKNEFKRYWVGQVDSGCLDLELR